MPDQLQMPSVQTQGRIDWDNQPLGKVSDRELAERLKVPWGTVYSARKSRGIAAHHLHDYPPKTPRKERLRLRLEDWSKVPLGQVPDHEAGALLGVSEKAAFNARQRLGIPAYKGKKRYRISSNNINWDEQPLGKMPDWMLANHDHDNLVKLRLRTGRSTEADVVRDAIAIYDFLYRRVAEGFHIFLKPEGQEPKRLIVTTFPV